MRLDRFTTLAQQALADAQSIAAEKSHGEITPMHLLGAMLSESGGAPVSILNKVGADVDRLRTIVDSELSHLPTISGAPPQTGSGLVIAFTKAEQESKKLGDSYVSTEHLLLACELEDGAHIVIDAASASFTFTPRKAPRSTASVRWCRWADAFRPRQRRGRRAERGPCRS